MIKEYCAIIGCVCISLNARVRANTPLFEEINDGLRWQFTEESSAFCAIKHVSRVSGKDGDTNVLRRVAVPRELGGMKAFAVGRGVFARQDWLAEVVVPDSVSQIDMQAFVGCANLTNVVFQSSADGRRGVLSIRSEAFAGCVNLKTVKLPSCLNTVSSYAFADCRNLTDVVLPDGLMWIGGGAFAGCESLKSVRLPFFVDLDRNPFPHCPQLEFVNVDTNNQKLCCVDGVLYGGRRKLLIVCPAKHPSEKMTIPEGVECICNGAFSCTRHLVSIQLPKTLRVIMPGAFRESGIRSVVIPDGVEFLGEAAFASSALTKIVIGPSVSTIGRNCFARCAHLKEIHFKGGLPSVVEEGMFAPSNCVLYVNRGRGWDGVSNFRGCRVLDESSFLEKR